MLAIFLVAHALADTLDKVWHIFANIVGIAHPVIFGIRLVGLAAPHHTIVDGYKRLNIRLSNSIHLVSLISPFRPHSNPLLKGEGTFSYKRLVFTNSTARALN